MTSWNDDVITEFRESKGTTNYWGPKLILMHTLGAKSGEERLTPVVGFRNDAGWMVVETVRVTAGLIEPERYAAAWAAIVDEAPSFGEYPEKAGGRTIPIYQLSRA